MATWAKENAVIQLKVAITMADDTSAHTVKYQPSTQTYPTGAITGTQGTSDLSCYYPSSDLDDEYHYDIYVDDTKVGRLSSPISVSPIM